MYFEDTPKYRHVKCISAVEGLEIGKVYEAIEEKKSKIWNDVFEKNDSNLPTLYTVIIDSQKKIEHIDSNLFEIQTIKKVKYNGGWGSPSFVVYWNDIHAPLTKGGVYEVIAEEELQTFNGIEMVYELRLENGSIVVDANSSHFTDVK